MIYFIILILLMGAAEVAARLLYYRRHGLKFVPKRIGEYPYNKFIEECSPPLHWRLKPCYGEGEVHINSLGLRSPERREGYRHIYPWPICWAKTGKRAARGPWLLCTNSSDTGRGI